MDDPKRNQTTQREQGDEGGIEIADQAEGERNEGRKQTKVERNPDQAEGDEASVADIPGADKESSGNQRNQTLQQDPGGHS